MFEYSRSRAGSASSPTPGSNAIEPVEDATYEILPQTCWCGSEDNEIVSANEPHLALALLLDVSPSMGGMGMRSLNEGIRRFKADLAGDLQAQASVDVAVVTFSNTIEVVQDFVPLPAFEPPTLETCGTGTHMGAAILEAADVVENRCRLYSSLGTPSHRPWVVMITDGKPTDDVSAARDLLRAEDERGVRTHLKFFALGTPGHDEATLSSLTRRYMTLDGQNFAGFFHWLSDSMSIMSDSRPGENPQLPALPAGVTLPPTSW